MAERQATCEEIREELPAYVKDRGGSLSVRRHLSRCADCRNELARYDSLVEMLGGLEMKAVEPPPGLASALAAIPSNASRLAGVRTHVARNRARYLSGAAVLVAGAAGAAVLQRRRRIAPA
jgi:predicted anti-sigma-YlaC factor YlaD